MIDSSKFLEDTEYAEQVVKNLIQSNLQQLIKDRYMELTSGFNSETKEERIELLFKLQSYCRHPNIVAHMEPCPDCGYEQRK